MCSPRQRRATPSPSTSPCLLCDLFFLSGVVSAPCTVMSLPKNAGRRRGEAEGALAETAPRRPQAPQGQPWPELRSSRLLPSGIYDLLLGQSWLAPPEIKQGWQRAEATALTSFFVPSSSRDRGASWRAVPWQTWASTEFAIRELCGLGPVAQPRWASVSPAGRPGILTSGLAQARLCHWFYFRQVEFFPQCRTEEHLGDMCLGI